MNIRVTVYGAYGHTGQFVVAELLKRGWRPVLSGRNADQLKAIGNANPTSYLLHPPLLDESGLCSALNWYTQGLVERSGLQINLDISQEFGKLPGDMELVVFRLVQECLTNIHRHSGSKAAAIRIGREAGQITAEVADEGNGMSPQRLSEIQSGASGVGIRGISERLRQFKGEMKIESDSKGTRILVKIPLGKIAIVEDESDTEPLRAAM